MKHLKSGFYLLAILWLGSSEMMGQEVIPAAGNDAYGNGGSASYSVGQLVYNTYNASEGSLAEGVQQPYEVSIIIGIKETNKDYLVYTLFPNPTSEHLQLEIPVEKVNRITYWLYNMEGKLLQNEKLRNTSTIILVENLPPATYFLKLLEDEKEIQTFKIIKN